MTTNRLIAAVDGEATSQAGELGRDGVERYCAEQNERAKRLGMDRFCRPREVKVGDRVIVETEVLEGVRAQEARAEAEGRPLDRFVPDRSDLALLRRGIERMASKGRLAK